MVTTEQKERLLKAKVALSLHHELGEECAAASNIAAASVAYKERVMDFLAFINVMRGKYHDATFQENRNALDVLGVKVCIRQVEKGISGVKGSGKKAIEITYLPQFSGVSTS